MSRRWRVRFARLATVLALGSGIVLLTPAPGHAHATLVGTSPANGTQLDTPPDEVRLQFSERVAVVAGGVVLHDATGDQVPTEPAFVPEEVPDEVRLPVPADLPDGTWVVSWRVVSADSHPVAGALVFSVGEAVDPDVDPADIDPDDAAVSAVFTAVRWAGYAGLALLAGGLCVFVACWPDGWRHRRARRVVLLGWATSTAGAMGSLLLQGPYSTGETLAGVADPALLAATAGTDYGRYVLVRLALLVAAGFLVVAASRLPGPARTTAALVLGVALPATWIGTGHTNTAGSAFDVVTDTIHLVAMAAWFGGLALLAGCVLSRTDPIPAGQVRAVLRRFSMLAAGSVATLVATGVYIAWREVGSLTALAGTSYGRLLAFKLAVVGILLWLGGMSNAVVRRRYAQPVPAAPDGAAPAASRSRRRAARSAHEDELQARARLHQSVRLEIGTAVAVLAVASVLAATPPGVVATATAEAAEAGAPAPPVATQEVFEEEDLIVQVLVDPARTGVNTLGVTVTNLNQQPRDVPEVTASFTLPGEDWDPDTGTGEEPEMGPLPVPVEQTGPGEYESTTATLPAAGGWRLRLAVRVSQIDSVTALFDVPVS